MERSEIQKQIDDANDRLNAAISDLVGGAIRGALSDLFTGNLEGQCIFPTGDGPFADDDLWTLTQKMGVACHDDLPDEGVLVVLGRENFDTAVLDEWAVSDTALPFDFCSQEAFLNLWLFGVKPDYYPGDPRIDEHPGLSYVAERSIEWPWPSTEVSGIGDYAWDTDHWSEESPLRANFGYSVSAQSGLSGPERRRILDRAVRSLPLHQVAHHIAWLARMNKGRDDDRYALPVAKWEEDLAYLKSTYYDGSFGWPRTDR